MAKRSIDALPAILAAPQEAEEPQARAKRPIPATIVPISPFVISQENCHPAFGLKSRRYLELIVEYNIPCRKLGKLRLVEVSTLLRYLAVEPIEAPQAPTPRVVSAEDEEARVLAAIGRRRAR